MDSDGSELVLVDRATFQTVTLVPSRRPVDLEPTLLAATQHSYELSFALGESAEPAPLSAGQVIAGKYIIERLLGAGGMGAVYAARHRVTGKELALKCMNTQVTGSVRAMRRFVREARAAGRIHHPNVVDVHDVGQDGSLSFIIMEMLHGEPLSRRLLQDPLAPDEAIGIMVPLLRGIAAAHARGVVHRDLKPDNVFLCREPGRDAPIPKVIDFGIAKILSLDGPASSLTRSGALLGTPSYLSPEQAEGADVDGRADVFACGVILYRMVTGALPYGGATLGQYLLQLTREDPVAPSERVPGLPRELSDVILRAMARDPDARYPDAETFARALERDFRGVLVSQSRTTTGRSLAALLLALAIAGAACLSALTTWFVMR